MKSEYLLFNALVFLPVFVIKNIFFKIKLKENHKFLKAIIITALIFIIKDILSTNFFWYFNKKYTLGINFFNLPVEEVMFFFTVPYSTLFVYQIINYYIKDKNIEIGTRKILVGLILSLIGGVILLLAGKFYTGYILVFFAISLFLVRDSFTKNRIIFYLSIFLLTLFFNSYLTSRPVVIYNQNYILGLRLFSVPVEDFFYSLSLFNLLIFFVKEKTQLRRDKIHFYPT